MTVSSTDVKYLPGDIVLWGEGEYTVVDVDIVIYARNECSIAFNVFCTLRNDNGYFRNVPENEISMVKLNRKIRPL